MRQTRLELAEHVVVVQLDAHAQQPVCLAALHGQQAMRGNSLHGLLVFEVHLELGGVLLLAALDLRVDAAESVRLFAQPAACLHVLRPLLGHDVAGALEGGLLVRHVVLGIDERPQHLGPRPAQRLLLQQQIRQRLQPALASRRGPCPPLGFERQIQVLQHLLVLALLDLLSQLRRQQPLLVDRPQDRGLASSQLMCLGQRILDHPQRRLVQPAGRLLAIARDEGQRVAVLQQLDGGPHLALGHSRGGGNRPHRLLQVETSELRTFHDRESFDCSRVLVDLAPPIM